MLLSKRCGIQRVKPPSLCILYTAFQYILNCIGKGICCCNYFSKNIYFFYCSDFQLNKNWIKQFHNIKKALIFVKE